MTLTENTSYKACSDFTRVTARWIARPPEAAFVTRLSGCPSKPLVSYQINRQLSGRNPPPQVTRAFGAHRNPANFAISVAGVFEVHLAAVSFNYEPIVPVTDTGGIPFDYIEAQQVENEKIATDAKAQFDETALRAGLSSVSFILKAEFSEAPNIFGRLARRFDLSVLSQAGPDKHAVDGLIIESALFDSGRPVLVTPYIQKSALTLNRVMVCWDGSRNAARAVSDAMPFLQKAGTIEVVTITGEAGKSDELPGADIAQHSKARS